MKRYLKDFFYGIVLYVVVAILALIIYAAFFVFDLTKSVTINQVYIAGSVLSLIVSFAFAWKSKPRSKSEAGWKGLIWMATSILLLIITIAPGFKVLNVLLGVFGFWVYMLGILLGPLLYALTKHLK
jgi:nitrate reductase NapE component